MGLYREALDGAIRDAAQNNRTAHVEALVIIREALDRDLVTVETLEEVYEDLDSLRGP